MTATKRTKKKKVGRPPVNTMQVTIRLSPETDLLLALESRKRRLSKSAFVEQAILEKIEKLTVR
jgi:predicted DNA-binding protein